MQQQEGCINVSPKGKRRGTLEFNVRTQWRVRRKTKIRKKLAIIGVTAFVIGIVLVAFSTQTSYEKENTLWTWTNLWSGALKPQSEPGPLWTIDIPEGGGFFELNVSATDSVRVRIGTPGYDNVTQKDILVNILFDQTKTSISQRVDVEGGFYEVNIRNEGTVSVLVWGDVKAKNTTVTYQTVYPYSSSGTLVVLGGFASLIYGVLTKSKKRHVSAGNVRICESASLV